MKKRWIIALSILTLIIALVIKTLLSAGVFSHYPPRFEGSTEIFDGPTGVEDISIDQNTGQAFLSADDRRNFKTTTGKIYTISLEDSIKKPVEMKILALTHNFHPHGISYFKTKAGEQLLFVINHADKGHFVEKFLIKNDTLALLKSYESPLFLSPNDLVAVGENEFYFTNDHNKKMGLQRTIEDFLQIKTGFVAYFDGKNATKVSDDIAYANGINVSNDGKYLYASSTIGRDIWVFDRNKDNSLKLNFRHDAQSGGLDNIEVDKNGILWVGTHLKMLHFLEHSKKENIRSESAVLKMDIQAYSPKPFILQEGVYVNDGNPISGVSVGAFYLSKKQEHFILIGSVFEPKVVLAKRKI
jgi:arylesterase / paraoxonase